MDACPCRLGSGWGVLSSCPHTPPIILVAHSGGHTQPNVVDVPSHRLKSAKIYGSVPVQTRKKPNRTIENGSQWSGSRFDDFVELNHGSVLGSRRGPSEPD
ncbi:hypothetical protein P692DRAFT_201794003 [Suillus brevipes Sb2]|nr:hypothetical protein P692DRAFT_201794003 [Suillus brevipes Sb2]